MVERPSLHDREARLDAVFKALADPTRRAIVDILSYDDATLSDLARPMPMSLPAVAKHVDVLERAGIVSHTRAGREKSHRLVREPLRRAGEWIRRYGPV